MACKGPGATDHKIWPTLQMDVDLFLGEECTAEKKIGLTSRHLAQDSHHQQPFRAKWLQAACPPRKCFDTTP